MGSTCSSLKPLSSLHGVEWREMLNPFGRIVETAVGTAKYRNRTQK